MKILLDFFFQISINLVVILLDSFFKQNRSDFRSFFPGNLASSIKSGCGYQRRASKTLSMELPFNSLNNSKVDDCNTISFIELNSWRAHIESLVIQNAFKRVHVIASSQSSNGFKLKIGIIKTYGVATN